MPAVSLLTLVLLGTIAVGATAAILAWRERSEPGAKPLVAMLVGQCWWSIFLVFQIQATTLEAKALWVDVSWIGVVVIPVAWLLFALEYTGSDQYVRSRYVALLSIVPAVTVLLALTGQHHDLLYADSTLVHQGGRSVIVRRGGPWFWIIAGYTYFLGLLGSIPLLGLLRSDAGLFRGQGLALLIGTIAPWAINVLFLLGAIPTSGLDPTPIGFAISGVAYLGAITRFRLFGTSPAPTRSARRLVFQRMHDGAVVVDRHDYVVDVNENAGDILGVPPREALGRSAAELIPRYDELPADDPAPKHLTVNDDTGAHFYDATVTRIDDSRGRTIGRVITFHDVGEHLRQQQRLEVLNRVLRHNIRTETNLISGYADVIEGDDDAEAASQIKEHAERIDELGEKAREIAEVFDREGDPAEPVPLEDLLTDAVESVSEGYPAVAFDYRSASDDVHVARVFAPVFSNVVENAVEHNTSDDPAVSVHVETVDGVARVHVADNGPGIHEYERTVLERGRETPLEHGSGLGLWLIKWGTSIGGGQVSFEEGGCTGSVITVTAPVLSPAVPAGGEPDRVAAEAGDGTGRGESRERSECDYV